MSRFDRRQFCRAPPHSVRWSASAPTKSPERPRSTSTPRSLIALLSARSPTTSITFSSSRWSAPALAWRAPASPRRRKARHLKVEWGLALHIRSTKGSETRRYLLDYGFTSNVYLNNLDLMKIDPTAVDAMILSHGHFDRWGGLIGFLEARRGQMKQNLRLYTGGEDNFCHRVSRNPDGSFAEFGGVLDRIQLKKLNVTRSCQRSRSSLRATPSRLAQCRGSALSTSCPIRG